MRGGVDLVQLRDKTLDDDGLVEAARAFRGHDALFILNDRPDLVEACGADGVHVGQDDADARREARALDRPGPDRRAAPRTSRRRPPPRTPTPTSTTSPSARCTRRRPSRAARPPGCDYVAHAASTVAKPWFAIGGLDAGNVHEVVERGATRIVVVRAITEAEDPEAAARELRAALEEPARARH